jgi:cobalamin biosynthesis protein CbiG
MPPSDAQDVFLGIGLSGQATAAEALALAEQALAAAGAGPDRLSAIATIASRRGHMALLALADHFRCDIRYFDVRTLEAETPRLKHPSEALFARIGCHGVAEAAALAAAGNAATLIVGKIGGGRVTAAVAGERGKF